MILVTTPDGKVGSEVAKQLMALDAPVRIGAHTLAKAQRAFPGGDIVPFDFNDEASVQHALHGITALYLASPPMQKEPITRVVDLAKAAGVRRIVRLSAMGVEQGDSALRQVELHIEQSSLDWTFLRPNWFMQNYSTSNAQTIREGGALYEPAADARTSFVDVRDIAAVAVKALTEDGHAGQAYPITGGRAYDRHEVAAAIGAAMGKTVRYVPLSDEQFRSTMAQLGWSQDYVEVMSNLYGSVRAGWTEAVTDSVERVTGKAPITFEQFAQDYRDAWV